METSPEYRGDRPELARVRVIDCAECGIDHYWCDACQRAVCAHSEARVSASYHPGSLFCSHPAVTPASLEALRPFVASVLAEISAEATLVELTELPDRQYGLRIEIRREVGKSFMLPRGPVDDAVIHPVALRTLRSILHAEVLALHSGRTLSDRRGRVWPDS